MSSCGHFTLCNFLFVSKVCIASVNMLFSTSHATANSYSIHRLHKQWVINHLLLHLPINLFMFIFGICIGINLFTNPIQQTTLEKYLTLTCILYIYTTLRYLLKRATQDEPFFSWKKICSLLFFWFYYRHNPKNPTIAGIKKEQGKPKVVFCILWERLPRRGQFSQQLY